MNRPRLMELFAKYPEKTVIIFKTREEATDMGRPLYEKYGFVKMNDEMELR